MTEEFETFAGASSAPTPSTSIAASLSSVVATFGTGILDDPRRVRACLTDELGAAGWSRRAELDAVIMAVEEGVVIDLRGDHFDRAEASSTLAARGLSNEVAGYAIDVWSMALGVTSAAGPTVEPTIAPLVVDLRDTTRLPDDITTPDAPPVVVTPPEVPTVVADGPAAGASPDRKRLLMALGAVAVVALIAGVVLVFTRSDGTTGVSADPAPINVVRVSFPVEQLPWGATMTRTWTKSDQGVHGQLDFTNATTATVSGRHVEVIPNSLAATADLVVSDPTPSAPHSARGSRLTQDAATNPTLGYDVSVEAGKTTTINYDIAVGDVTQAKLATWQTEQVAAAAAYVATTTTTTTTTTIPPVVAPADTGPAVDPGTTPTTPTTLRATPPTTVKPKVPPTTVAPPTTPAPPTTLAPLVANDDHLSGNAQPVQCTADGICYAGISLNVVRNDTGAFTGGGYVTLPTKGELRWDQANYQYVYYPGQDGPYTDSFTYQNKDKSGRVSNIATVTISIS